MAGRRYTRPRTRLYDCNYSLGESYYRPALDTLDRKYGGGGLQETLEAPKRPERPLSMGSIEGLLEERRPNLDAINSQIEEDMESMSRMHRARARHQASTEENFENAFLNRREEVKRKFSEKMLDSVGINGASLMSADEDNSTSLRRRALRMVAETEEESPRMHKWSALKDPLEETIEDMASKNRARMSRARLADLENEMEELAERGAARERRLVNLRQILGDSQSSDTSAVRLKKTVTITEKRVAQ